MGTSKNFIFLHYRHYGLDPQFFANKAHTEMPKMLNLIQYQHDEEDFRSLRNIFSIKNGAPRVGTPNYEKKLLLF